MPEYHPIFLTGEAAKIVGEDEPIVIMSTNYHHGGAVLYGIGYYNDNGELIRRKGLFLERDFIDTQFGWEKIDASTVYDIKPEVRNNNNYAVVYLKKNGMELLASYQLYHVDYVRCMNIVAKVRDATMFAQRYGFSVPNLIFKKSK